MRVSVVACTHAIDRYPHLRETVESVLANGYGDREVVVVSDGSEAVYDRAREEFGDRDDVRVHLQEPNQGLLAARNAGAAVADGDVVAFIDDDAVADADWITELVGAYEDHDAIAAGGRMTPEWVAGKPAFLPAEFYWLVGVTHRGFADGEGEVRNTFGSNISFRRDVFLDLGGFDPAIGGRRGDANLQGGETELCARMRVEYGRGVYYVPDAEVAHTVFAYRTDPGWLLDRAFWQGYSKRAMETLTPDAGGDETDFLRRLVFEFVPRRCRGLLTSPSLTGLAQLVALFAFTAAVGAGYLYGAVRW